MAFIDGAVTVSCGPVSLSGIGSMLMGSPALISQQVSIYAPLIRPIVVKNVRAVSSTRIRVEFAAPLSNNADSDLAAVSGYLITPIPGSVPIAILSVDTPESVVATASLDLIVSEMTNGFSNYSLKVVGDFFSETGSSPVDHSPFVFNGVGVAPKVFVALALSSTSVQVQFDEKVLDLGSIRDVPAYTFNDGLTVASILSVDASSVTLKTSAQTPGHLYTLTLTGVWYDNAMNAMIGPVATPILGYVTPQAKDVLLSLNMYNFLIQGLRDSDQKDGLQFLERFFSGPQAIWSATMQTIFDLPKLWDVSEIADELLQYMKRIVGWTSDLDPITNGLDASTLRRLIAASARYWKTRGPEESIINILALTTGARCYILNWFDLRFILDETINGEEGLGHDPWLLSTPGEGDPDSQTYNIRIVDDGSLDHVLVRNLAKLTRPSGERVQINYLGFLDQFESDKDETQWGISANSLMPHVVANGVLRFDSTSNTSKRALVKVDRNQDWTRQVISWRFKTNMGNPQLLFYAVGDPSNPSTVADYYYISISTERATGLGVANKIRLIKRIAGVDTTLATVDTVAVFGEPVQVDVTYTIRVVVAPVVEGVTTNSIVVYWDGEPIINHTSDSSLTQGTIGLNLVSGLAAAAYFELEELEMFFLPRALDFIDIGNEVTSIVPQPVIPPLAPVLPAQTNPATIITSVGVTHWWRADKGISIDVNTSAWNDQIGSAHIIQASSSKQAAYNSSDPTYNFLATVTCDGIDDQLMTAGNVDLTGPIFIISIVKLINPTNTGPFYATPGGFGSGGNFLQTFSGSIYQSGPAMNANADGAVAAMQGNWALFLDRRYGNAQDYVKFGNRAKVQGAACTLAPAPAIWGIGGAGGIYLNAAYREIIICNGEPTPTELANIKAYALGQFSGTLA